MRIPAASRVAELRPSAAISSGRVKLAPVFERDGHAMLAAVDLVTRDFHSSQMFLPASARA